MDDMNFWVLDRLREILALMKQTLIKDKGILFWYCVTAVAFNVCLPIVISVLLVFFVGGLLETKIRLKMLKLYGYPIPKSCNSLRYLVKEALVSTWTRIYVSFFILFFILLLFFNFILLKPLTPRQFFISGLVHFCLFFLLFLFKVRSHPVFLLTKGNFFRKTVAAFNAVVKEMGTLSLGDLMIAITFALFSVSLVMVFIPELQIYRFIANPLCAKIFLWLTMVIPVMLSAVLNSAYNVVLCKHFTSFD